MAAKMTRAHFELIAETVANMPTMLDRDSRVTVTFEDIVRELADMLASTNGMFDRQRFLNACYTENYRAPRNVTRY